MYLGDVPPATITYGGIATNATFTNAASVMYITITHPTISYNYIPFVKMYSPRVSTTDNDPFQNGNTNWWVYKLSST